MFDLQKLNDVQLNRLYCRTWQRIERIYGSMAWDYPTMYQVEYGFFCILQSCKWEALRRLHG